MAVIWSDDAFGDGTFADWSGQQEIAADRVTIVAPPGEVTSGPQSRSFLGRFRIQGTADTWPSSDVGRAEVLRNNDGIFQGHLNRGSSVWCAWETYFGDPNSVSDDANAFRPTTGTNRNTLLQFHHGGAGSPPLTFRLDTTAGSASTSWVWDLYHAGNTALNPIPNEHTAAGTFSYGWHEFRLFVNWAQNTGEANSPGRLKLWIDEVVKVDFTGNVGFTDYPGHYFKTGYYRLNSANNSTVYQAGTRMGTTEADVIAGGGTEPPPDPTTDPAANVRERRFGKETLGGGVNGLTQNRKRGCKFATGLAVDEEADVYDAHVWLAGNDASASTQKVTLGLYRDDGIGGGPGTKFGEFEDELTLAGNVTGAWNKVENVTPIRMTGLNAWLVVSSATPSNRLATSFATVANALAFNDDTYDASPPRMIDPFGTFSLDAKELSICADYDVVGGGEPVSYDASAFGASGSGAFSFSHTCTGDNRVLYVFVTGRGAPGSSGVSSLTYDGVALTRIANLGSGNVIWTELWRLIAPNAGTHSVALSSLLVQRVTAHSVSVSGAHQTVPNGSVVTGSGSASSAPSLVVPSDASELVLDGCAIQNDDNTTTLTVGSGQTQRSNTSTSNGTSNGIRGAQSSETGDTSVTMTWTPDANDDWAQIAVSVKPAQVGDVTAPVLQTGVTSINGAAIILSYDEPLDTGSVPATSDFAVTVNGASRSVTGVTVAGSDVQLVLASPVDHLAVVVVSYTASAGSEIADIAGNHAANLVNQAVTNETDDIFIAERITTVARVTTTARGSDPTARTSGTGGGGV